MEFKLQPKQGKAFLAQSTETLYGGAAFGGKSHLMRVAAITWASEIAGLQIYLFRRTYPDLWSNHMEGPTGFPVMLARLISSRYVKIDMGKKKIGFWNGSTIFLRHCQYETDVYNYQGPEFHVLMIDEMTQWDRSMYLFLRSRVRMVGINLPDKYKGLFPRILVSANPGGIGHNWVKQMFVDLGPGQHQMPSEEGGMLREFIPARLEDNPEGLKADPTYEQRLEGLGNKELVRAMRLGDWDIIAGGAIDDVWDRDIHVVKPFKIPSSWRVDRTFDWGASKPFSVGWWAESDGTPVNGITYPRGTVFRIAEWYGYSGIPNEGIRLEDIAIGKGIREHEDRIKETFGIKHVLAGPADSSIYDSHPGKDSIARGIDTGYNQRGCFVQADKSPGSRKNGLEVVRRMLNASRAERMESPGLFIFDTCIHFIRTVPVLPRDPKNPDDVDTDAEDHIFDETRYRLTAPKLEARRLSITGV